MQRQNNANDSLANGLSEKDIRQIKSIVPPDDIITTEVLYRLREGDHESYKKVYLHWRKPIYKFVFNLTGSAEEADDITQEIFTVLWNYKSKIDPEKNIRSFLYLVARRMIYKSNRANQIREKYTDSVWMSEKDDLTSYDIVVEKEAELLKQALLQRMPPQQRKIFEMNHHEGLSPEEIADRLGIKRESVYNQLSKARKEIRDAILLLLLVFMDISSDDAVIQILESLFY